MGAELKKGKVGVVENHADEGNSLADRMGVGDDTVVMEIGYDEDCDEALRDSVAERTGDDLLGEDTDEIVDMVLLWWRESDGDLFEALTDALTPLAEDGTIWLLTPKPGRDGHVEPTDVAEAVPTAGLTQTSTINAAADWAGVRLMVPKAGRGKK